MINWSNYFDKIYCLSYVKNVDRRNIITQEFNRLGITNYEFYINIDDEFLIYNNIYTHPQTNCAHGHYTIIKRAYGLGYNRIMICEDDCIFLRSLETVSNVLNEYNGANADIFLFNGANFGFEGPHNYIIYSYVQNYAVNRQGMEYLIYMHEKYHFNQDQYYFPKRTQTECKSLTLLFDDGSGVDLAIPEQYKDIRCEKFSYLPLSIEYNEQTDTSDETTYDYTMIIHPDDLCLYNQEYYPK